MKVDKSWTLFLDRDGVINTEIHGDYVKNVNEFHFEPGALSALKYFSELFGKIIVVTNQRGVGAGFMSQQDLDDIHDYMLKEIENHGGRIDRIYSATSEDRSDKMRKPNPAMGYMAKNDFPEIEFSKSMIAGNTLSDMQFGKALGIHTVFIDDRKLYNGIATPEMDLIFNSLESFSFYLKKKN